MLQERHHTTSLMRRLASRARTGYPLLSGGERRRPRVGEHRRPGARDTFAERHARGRDRWSNARWIGENAAHTRAGAGARRAGLTRRSGRQRLPLPTDRRTPNPDGRSRTYRRGRSAVAVPRAFGTWGPCRVRPASRRGPRARGRARAARSSWTGCFKRDRGGSTCRYWCSTARVRGERRAVRRRATCAHGPSGCSTPRICACSSAPDPQLPIGSSDAPVRRRRTGYRARFHARRPRQVNGFRLKSSARCGSASCSVSRDRRESL